MHFYRSISMAPNSFHVGLFVWVDLFSKISFCFCFWLLCDLTIFLRQIGFLFLVKMRFKLGPTDEWQKADDDSIYGVLGTWTWGNRMEGTDKSTELLRHPRCRGILNKLEAQKLREKKSSVDSSAPSILLPRVRVPSTSSTFSSIFLFV